ncbi:signal recognition particle protein [Arthrobacter sp. Hiyo8]|nr:signal recognition particle protein [Arthrobacter sp. Hiyo8]
MASRILDMGDVLTLIEQAEKNWDKDEAARMAKKFADQEDFTLDDFLAQMQQIRNMGSMKKMLMMMPGAQNIRQQLEQFDEREIDRVEAIVRSMTRTSVWLRRSSTAPVGPASPVVPVCTSPRSTASWSVLRRPRR